MYEDCVLQSMRFPQKLWQIVNECETEAIRWSASGDTILVDYKRFQAEYMDARRPIFKTSNITSFIRQLNLYGFRKITCHGRDPACNSRNPHVHEFLHDNFRINREDLLSKVCRKAGGKVRKDSQHEATRTTEESPRLKPSPMSRLEQCQLALSKELERLRQEYRQKREEEEESIITEDNAPKRIRNSQEDTVSVYGIESSNVPNRKPLERSVESLTFYPFKEGCKVGTLIINLAHCYDG